MILAADSTDQAVQSALNFAYLVLGVVIGVVAGIVVAFIVSILLRAALGRTRIVSAMLRRTRGPSYWALMAWGAVVGFNIALRIDLQGADASTAKNSDWVEFGHDTLVVLAIVATTWVLYAAMWVVEDAARLRHAADGGVSRRFETQAQVLRRLLQALVALIGFLTALLFAFPAARTALGTLLASAGVVSVIAGLAAQSTLGNVFAGIQLAFTDAIRVGDVVVVGDNQESGVIEEITLTYVVVRVWDERRLIMPSTEFASKPFENWTRRAARQLGTVELKLDWAAPMAQIREKVEHLLLATDLWDGRTWSVQMTDSDAGTVTVRILTSAKDSGTLWDLRCYLRENLISWIASEEAWARPVDRYQPQKTVTVTHDTSREVVARLATELSGIAGPDTTSVGGGAPAAAATSGTEPTTAAPDRTKPVDAFHAARIQAARRKAKRARRRALAARQRDASGQGTVTTVPGTSSASTGTPVPDTQRTRVFTADELAEIARRYDEATAVRLAREAPGGHGAVPAPGTPPDSPTAPAGGTAAPAPAGPAPTPATAAPAPASTPRPDVTPSGAGTGGGGAPGGTTPEDVPTAPSSGSGKGTDPAVEGATPATVGDGSATTVGKGERLYSGSPDAEERGAIFSGPGDDVIAEREQTAMMRAVRSGSALTGTSTPPSGEGVDAIAKAVGTPTDEDTPTPAAGDVHPDGGAPTPGESATGGGSTSQGDSSADTGEREGKRGSRTVHPADGAVEETRVMPAVHPDQGAQGE